MAKKMPAAADSARQGVLPLLEHLTRLGKRVYISEMTPGGLRPRHLITLRLLADRGPLSQQGLGEALSLDPSNVVGLLNDLEERGLIVRRRDPADRRRHIVELSPSGEEEVVLSDERAVVVEDRLFAALDADERTTLYELLQRAVGTTALSCEVPGDNTQD
jgi:DNA-binding MarR family transcriptional regulator